MKYNRQSLYYEALARLTLLYLFPQKFSKALSLEDRPDLHDIPSDIGVEVTRALIKSAGEKIKITADSTADVAYINPLSRLSKIECELGQYSRKDYVYPLRQVWKSEAELNTSFIRKLNKMNAPEFSIFKENDLYIYSPSIKIFNSRELHRFIGKAAELQATYENRFDIVFINDFGNFFTCDLRLQEVREFELSPEKLLEFCVEAKEFTLDILRKTDI
jgi:hypothetical protein